MVELLVSEQNVADPESLILLILYIQHIRLRALGVCCPQALVMPALVVADHRIGNLQDILRRSVVLFELDGPGSWVQGGKAEDIVYCFWRSFQVVA
ncbi:hypothetical protein SDC9_89617 [bioreactor metagenome]|uniref:Uncharacterized protein n=1 Tax=bioreactor metagenome TaxID=1076179 RepID=A0A644ZPX9_9ZZZZ